MERSRLRPGDAALLTVLDGMRSAAVACAAIVLLSSCTRQSVGGTGRHSWSHPGVLRVSVVQEPKSLNPLLATTTTDIFIDRLMFEPLVSADPHGTAVPMLAEEVPTTANGGIAKDGLTVTYRLRKDVVWSDGVPFTSADVKWSWQALVNPNNNVISRHGYDMIRAIDTPNASTAIVHLRGRFAPFVNTFFAESDQPYSIVPAHVLSKYPNVNQLPFNSEPAVGDGPFTFGSWQRGDRIVLAANAKFFKGRPGLDRIEIQIVPDDNTAINLLRTHAIDYIFQPSINTYPALKGLPDTSTIFVDMNAYEALEFNVARPGVSDPLVRRAIAYAIEKPSLVARLTHSQLKVATEDIPDWMWAFDPSVKSYPYDIRTAKALLAQAGWLPGPNGIVRRNGEPLALLLSTDNANATHREESLLVQEALARIGIDVEIKYYPQAMLYATAALGGILQTGKFDMTLAPWYAGIDPDDSSQFLCATQPPNGYNTSRYCNADMEAEQRSALASYDIPARKAAYSKVQHLLARDNPYIFFWWQRQQEAISNDFKGFAPNPTVESWNAWQWSI
ncbi:MAG: peptide ABC transporter substrate-binding protein [Candidatus Eremiobacteraeota bacterium]|nr:peptide ABC transporter substrate-binding protein [Candidatus Eremiobacteraeota bacterium]